MIFIIITELDATLGNGSVFYLILKITQKVTNYAGWYKPSKISPTLILSSLFFSILFNTVV